jgi:hypothetical protein
MTQTPPSPSQQALVQSLETALQRVFIPICTRLNGLTQQLEQIQTEQTRLQQQLDLILQHPPSELDPKTLHALEPQLEPLAQQLRRIHNQVNGLPSQIRTQTETLQALTAWIEQMQAELIDLTPPSTPPTHLNSSIPPISLKIRLLPLSIIISALVLMQTLTIVGALRWMPRTHPPQIIQPTPQR